MKLDGKKSICLFLCHWDLLEMMLEANRASRLKKFQKLRKSLMSLLIKLSFDPTATIPILTESLTS